MNIKTYLSLLGTATLIATGCKSTCNNMTAEKKENTPIIIDVRTPKEYAAGHLEDALHMPYDQIHTLLTTKITQKDARILLYCRSGNRSGKALKTIQAMGYSNAANIGAMPDAAKTTGKKIVK